PEFISQGREIFREMIVLAGTGFERSSREVPEKFEKIIKEIASWREKYRREKKWAEADRLRDILQAAGVVLEDTVDGPRWRY
ncbi:MAG: CysS/YqeB C-terminal domain-containing protein, partial [Bacillota bacterium]